MSRHTPIPDSRIVAALHQTGGVWRVLVATRTNGSFTVNDAREFTRSEHGHISTFLDQHQVGRILCVLPATDVICRVAHLPNAGSDQLMHALELQAETYVPGTIPAHRRAVGVLPAATGESTRNGLIVAWPRAAGPDVPVPDGPVAYVPDVVALAALMHDARSPEPMIWADRDSGAVALAITHTDGVSIRAARESAGSAADWQQGVARLVAETALTAGFTDSSVESLVAEIRPQLADMPADAGRLLLPSEYRQSARAHLQGVKDDATWWAKFGVPAGAVLATLHDLAPLTKLQRDAPIEKPDIFDRLFSRLGTWRAAAIWLVIAAVLLGVGPLAFSGAKLFAMHQKVGSLEEFERSRTTAKARIEMYRALAANTWPMHKLLGDVGNCAPEGLMFSSVTLDEGSNKVDIQGEADSQQLVDDMARAMRDSGIFEDITQSFSDRDSGRPKFGITARVRSSGTGAAPSRAFALVEWDDDFATNTLSMRMYPNEHRQIRQANEREEAGTARTTEQESTRVAAADTPRRPPVRDDDEEEVNDEMDDELDESSGMPFVRSDDPGRSGPRSVRPQANIPAIAQEGGSAPEPPKLPEPVSDEELAAMERPKLIATLAEVSNFMRRPGLTDEQKTALKEEFERLRQHLNEMPR